MKTRLKTADPVRQQADPASRPNTHSASATSGPRQQQQRDKIAQLQQAAPTANKTGLPDGLKTGIEALSGVDMSGVRVHRSSSKPAALQAHAYAQGSDIHLGPGQEKHLPHEAWHVVQQAQGRVSATRQTKGIGINDDSALEREADEMGARAASGTASHGGASMTGLASDRIIQRKERAEGDLDYGFSGPRHVAMTHVRNTGDDHRGDISPTVDHLNAAAGITPLMEQFEFHDLLDAIGAYTKLEVDVGTDKDKHVVRWVHFLKKNLHRINLKKQVDVATSGLTPREATKDRLAKNADSKLGAPDPQSIKDWYDLKTMPADGTEKERLRLWVWNTFFRITSKLGIEFTAEEGKAIHFNISKDAYVKALAGRDPKKSHGRNAITYSELRHLKRLQDRGQAPTVNFQNNSGGVQDVESPMQSLDMLDQDGVARLFQTPQWWTEAVGFETRLGAWLANSKPQARVAAQAGLAKMDDVLRDKNQSGTDLDQWKQHRKVFGKVDKHSAGQVPQDYEAVRSVIKGQAEPGADDINMREQMTAFYNAGLWNRGTTIKKVLTEIATIKDAAARKMAAAAVGIEEEQIEKVHAIIKPKVEATIRKIDEIAKLVPAERSQKIQTDLGLKDEEAKKLASAIHSLKKERRAYRKETDTPTRQTMEESYHGNKWDLAAKYADINILETDIDSDTSRPARTKRDGSDLDLHKKSSQDYTDMGVPLSNREKQAIGGLTSETASYLGSKAWPTTRSTRPKAGARR